MVDNCHLLVSVNNITLFDEIISSEQLSQKAYIYIRHLFQKNYSFEQFTLNFNRISNHNNQKKHQQKAQNPFDIDVLAEQILLFDNDAEIFSFIETQIQISQRKIDQLTMLSFSLIKLSQKYLHNKQSQFKKLPENLSQFYVKEELDSIQQKCLENLQIIKQKRKKLQSCVICWENYANRIIIPCMHLAICKNCTKIDKCPLCKATITNISIVYK